MSSISLSADRRAFGRRPTYQFAITHRSGRAPLRCVVRDISEGGALLEFGEPVSLPSCIRLVWEGSSLEADCEVRHIQGTRVGVQFRGDAGTRIVKESLKLNSACELPPLVPEPKRDNDDAGSATDLVQGYREQLTADAASSRDGN